MDVVSNYASNLIYSQAARSKKLGTKFCKIYYEIFDKYSLIGH